MDEQNFVNKKARTIEINSSSDREFFCIHGYTGSPTDFNQLGVYLNKRFGANVKIARLLGHGEKIENLKNLNYSDFLTQVESELQKSILKKRKIVLVGISVGSLLALSLSSKFDNIRGIVLVSPPIDYKFPGKILEFLEPIIFKKYFKKPIPEYEQGLRKNAFCYPVNLRGLRIIKQGKNSLKNSYRNVNSPCLLIHVEQDKLFKKSGVISLQNQISSKISKLFLFEENSSHNPFYSPEHKVIYKEIGDFVGKNNLFD